MAPLPAGPMGNGRCTSGAGEGAGMTWGSNVLGVPSPVAKTERQMREQLAAVYRTCDRLGLNEGVCNHLTAMLPGSPFRFLVIRYGLSWDEVTADNLVAVDADGNIVAGVGPVETTAVKIHSTIHRSDPERYACVLHTHMPYTSALCTTDRFELSMCHQNSLKFYDDVAYDREYHGLVMDDNEGERIAKGMAGKRVLLHRSHGPIVAAESIALAFDMLYYLERASQVQVLAMSTLAGGGQLCTIDAKDAAFTKRQMDAEADVAARAHFGARIRELEQLDRARARWPSGMALAAAAAAGALAATALLRGRR